LRRGRCVAQTLGIFSRIFLLHSIELTLVLTYHSALGVSYDRVRAGHWCQRCCLWRQPAMARFVLARYPAKGR
jgi:hypothetical protein